MTAQIAERLRYEGLTTGCTVGAKLSALGATMPLVAMRLRVSSSIRLQRRPDYHRVNSWNQTKMLLIFIRH